MDQMDKAIINLWSLNFDPLKDLPNLRFELENIGGLSRQEADAILIRIKPDDLKTIYGGEEL